MSDNFVPELPRRQFLKAGGALVVGFAMAPSAFAQNPGQLTGATEGRSQPNPGDLDSWIAIHSDRASRRRCCRLPRMNWTSTCRRCLACRSRPASRRIRD